MFLERSPVLRGYSSGLAFPALPVQEAWQRGQAAWQGFHSPGVPKSIFFPPRLKPPQQRYEKINMCAKTW